MKYLICSLLFNCYFVMADCAVSALYHEARSEGYQGMVEVGNVIKNRVRSKHYPNTICGVIKQRRQFSYYPTKINTISDVKYMAKKYPKKHSVKDWLIAKRAWHDIQRNKAQVKFKDATHYHTKDKHPKWNLKKLGRYKNHIFYK